MVVEVVPDPQAVVVQLVAVVKQAVVEVVVPVVIPDQVVVVAQVAWMAVVVAVEPAA
jgi:hypothetical protein